MELFHGHPLLESTRFRLRPIRSEEVDRTHELGLAYWGGKPATSIEFARQSVEKMADEFRNDRGYHWLVESKVDGSIVAAVGFYRGFADAQGEVGYVVGSPFRGLGIMTELMPVLLAFGFGEKKLARIIAVTRGENAPSVALLKRFGFIHECDRDDGYRQFARTPLA
ncbi:MAG: GNAT family N-acetyltransferase [Bdellovibrionales bacterium]|nr:GNAT family N-acetyltransferase [Bdellovibrionales bacterium]